MIAIGIGANSKAQTQDIVAAIADAQHASGGADGVATLDTANFATQARDAAGELSLVFVPISLEALRNRNADCATRSERTLSLYGVASMAEAAALAGAGPGSHLIMPRRIAGNVTIAAAQSADEQGSAG